MRVHSGRTVVREPRCQTVEDDFQTISELGVADLGRVASVCLVVVTGEVIMAGGGLLGGRQETGDEPGLGLAGAGDSGSPGCLRRADANDKPESAIAGAEQPELARS